jgi:hypothetical protein
MIPLSQTCSLDAKMKISRVSRFALTMLLPLAAVACGSSSSSGAGADAGQDASSHHDALAAADAPGAADGHVSRDAPSGHDAHVALDAASVVDAGEAGLPVDSGASITGASTAACTPSPCTAGTSHGTTLTNVPNDDGTTSTRSYNVYRPTGLTNSAGNLAPAVLVFGADPNINPIADGSRFIVVDMAADASRSAWLRKNIDGPNAVTLASAAAAGATSVTINQDTAGFASLGTVPVRVGTGSDVESIIVSSVSGTTMTFKTALAHSHAQSEPVRAPDDEPYVNAVVESLLATENVDPKRVYAMGASQAGNMVLDMACDAQNSPLFRGFLADSSSFQQYTSSYTNSPTGGITCPSTNKDYFLMEVTGSASIDACEYLGACQGNPADAGSACDTLNCHLDPTTFLQWAAPRLGCSDTTIVSTTFGMPNPTNQRHVISGPCSFATGTGPAIETIGVVGGGHQYPCQDSYGGAQAGACASLFGSSGLPPTNGMYGAQEFWDFVSAGESH